VIELESLLAGIELHHQIALLDYRAGVQEMCDLQCASADGWRSEHFGMSCAQLAGQEDFHLEIAAFHACRGYVVALGGGRGAPYTRNHADNGAENNDDYRPR